MTTEERIKKATEARNTNFKKRLDAIDVDELRKLYIEKNWSYSQVREHFGITEYMLDRIIRENGLKKSRQQSASIVLQTKYSKAGGKDKYDKHVYETTCQNIINKGESIEEHYSKVGEKCRDAWNRKLPEDKQKLLDNIRASYLDVPDKLELAKQQRIKTNTERYGVDNSYKLAQYTANSEPNKLFAEALRSSNVIFQQEVYLADSTKSGHGYRFDFCLNNDTVLEINPWPFHNSTWSPIETSSPVIKSYHRDKTRAAADNGYRCIHVWDWDNKDKIVESLTACRIIYARNCTIRNIFDNETDEFLNRYHFQNTCRGQSIRLGLFYDDILIQVMTFGKPRYNKKYEYELLRLCTRFGYRVVGGAEKLFKHFVNNFSPRSIISYCDLSKFNGDVYSKLGMSLIDSGNPSRHWYNAKLKMHITDNFLRQRGFDQLLGGIFGTYGKGTSNDDLMLKHGFVEIYDCGQATFGIQFNNT